MQWFAQAPANIALIKYMGKKDSVLNLPDNTSLSYTLTNLLSTVEMTCYPGKEDRWEPLTIPSSQPFMLPLVAQQRFLKHLRYLKKSLHYSGSFIVRSVNNFPHSSGLASSASSFAALTKCTIQAICELNNTKVPSIPTQAQLSRHGSGSSCRSFFAPWALWTETNVDTIELAFNDLQHQVIIVSPEEKKVSSSHAHQRVKTSPYYPQRIKNATDNLQALLVAFQRQDWLSIYQICWREFQDMHTLFTDCLEPFSYMTADSIALLDQLQSNWQTYQDGPIVTMDAGPNIHLLYRPDQTVMAQKFKQRYLTGNYDVL
jgi:diphosphomevalonate decarboxylase